MSRRTTKVPENHPTIFDLSAIAMNTTHKITFAGLHRALWTEHKAKLIACYLRYFVYITKHGAYIDGFAGPQDPGQPDSWAAKLALDNDPKWIRSFFLCDQDMKQAEALMELVKSQPDIKDRTIEVACCDFLCDQDMKQAEALMELVKSQPDIKDRTIEVACCDFNKHVEIVLPRIGETIATFCLLDQRTFQCDWATVQKIARHKSEMKIEIFYFVPTGWLARSLSGLKRPEAEMTRWWGGDNWICLKGMRSDDIAESFRQRFLEELNYGYAYSWPIYEREVGNRIMYYMIHASDHDEAPKQMYRAYTNTTMRDVPMRQSSFEVDE